MLGSLSSRLSFLCVELDICNTSLLADLLVVAPGLMVHLTAFSGSASRPAPGEAPSEWLTVLPCQGGRACRSMLAFTDNYNSRLECSTEEKSGGGVTDEVYGCKKTWIDPSPARWTRLSWEMELFVFVWRFFAFENGFLTIGQCKNMMSNSIRRSYGGEAEAAQSVAPFHKGKVSSSSTLCSD